MEECNFFIKTSQPLKGDWKSTGGMITSFLWGVGWDVDSDGDEEGDEKIYQHLQNRASPEEIIVIERIEKHPLTYIYKTSSSLEYLSARTAYLLATVLEGGVSEKELEPFSSPSVLMNVIGREFNLEKAFERIKTNQK